MDWVWNWGGECFGYVEGEDLWTYSGHHVGKVGDGEIFGSDGTYLGELMNDRLITNTSKRSWRGYAFTPYGRRAGYARYASYSPYAMYAGHVDFPPADSL